MTTEDLDALLERARTRGSQAGLEYAGAVTPQEAWRLFQGKAASIIDVRTRPEWEFVGHIPESTLIEWKRYGEPGPNPQAFAEALSRAFSPEDTLLFLCRSAVRSHYAAEVATRVGFTKAFNILEGFEGDVDERSQRGALGGWRKAGLPWVQG